MIRVFFTILIFLSFFNSYAQNEIVVESEFDSGLLDKYLLNAVNSERRKKRLDSVKIDPALKAPCENQVLYMMANDYTGHQQKSGDSKTLSNRLEKYDCNHDVVVENVQSIDLKFLIGKNRNRLTYYKLAKFIVDNWKKNSNYYKNLINEKVTVVNQFYGLDEGYLYICQLLATRKFEEAYDFQKGDELYIKNKKPCLNCKKVQKKLNQGEGHAGWYSVSNDSIYYWNVQHYYKGKRKKNNIRLIFGHRGTIAIDVIHKEQFDCNGNPAYDNSLYHDGYYINYVTKSTLEKDIHPSPEFYQVYVGQVPAFKDTFYQVDLNLSKRWRPCMNNSIIYVNPDYFKPEEYFLLPQRTVVNNSEIINKDSISISVAFERNQTNQDTTIFLPLIKSLDSIVAANHTVTSIFYTGVASIEGNEKTNTQLIKKRGEIIKNYLTKYYPNITFKSLYYENFEDFRDGISLIGFPEVSELNDEQMRAWVNQNLNNPKVEALLNNTRQSIIKINFQDVISFDNEAYGLSVKRIEDLIEDNNYEDAKILFEVLANKVLEGDYEKKDSLLNLKIPEAGGFGKMHWDYFVYELNVSSPEVNAERLNKLKKMGAISEDTKYLEYRLMFNIFNRNDKIDVSDFGEMIAATRRKRTIAWLETLDYISGVINSRYDAQMVAPLIVQSTLKNKFNVYQTYFVCQYLIEWDYVVEPYLLLSKFARQRGLFPKLYKQYVKLGYYLQQFNNKREWKKIKAALKNLSTNHPEEFCDLFKWHQMGVRALENEEMAALFCETCN